MVPEPRERNRENGPSRRGHRLFRLAIAQRVRQPELFHDVRPPVLESQPAAQLAPRRAYRKAGVLGRAAVYPSGVNLPGSGEPSLLASKNVKNLCTSFTSPGVGAEGVPNTALWGPARNMESPKPGPEWREVQRGWGSEFARKTESRKRYPKNSSERWWEADLNLECPARLNHDCAGVIGGRRISLVSNRGLEGSYTWMPYLWFAKRVAPESRSNYQFSSFGLSVSGFAGPEAAGAADTWIGAAESSDPCAHYSSMHRYQNR